MICNSYVVKVSLALGWLIGSFFLVETDVLQIIELIFVSLMVLWVALLISVSKRRGVPAICSKCQNIMCCYQYTDEVRRHDLNGIVYLCHNCNIKFIDARPSACVIC